jgi:hypothetical protein
MSTDLFAPTPEAPSMPSAVPDGDLATSTDEGALSGSMDDTLRDRLAELNAGDDSAENADGRANDADRPRGADGKFLPRAAEAENQADAGADGVEQVEPPKPGEFKDIGPPKSWRPQAKAEWDSLSPALKEEAYKRENDFFKGSETYRAKAGVADVLWNEIAPYQAAIRAAGTDVPGAIRAVLGTAATLQMGTPAQKVQTLRSLAQQYGIDLNAVGMPSNNGADTFADPALDAVAARIARLEQGLNGIHATSQNSEHASAAAMLTEFESNPDHRYYNDVRQIMGALVLSGQASSLQEAYVQACRAHPQVFAAMEAETRAKADKERATEAAKARRLGLQSPRSTSAPGAIVAPGASMEETLRTTFREIQSR